MLILDLFSGTGSSTAAFEAAGHRVVRVELDRKFLADAHWDVGSLTAADLLQLCGNVRPDFVWASPPCTAFSVASIGHHWVSGGAFPVPRTAKARAGTQGRAGATDRSRVPFGLSAAVLAALEAARG